MIEISHFDGGIMIVGHAEHAEHGRDIVCAGVSALAQTLIQSLQELTLTEIKYDMRPGMVDIQYGLLSERARTLIDAFFIGCEAIAEQYPNNVTVSRRGTR